VYADAPSDDAEESAPPVASERQAKEIAGRLLSVEKRRENLVARDSKERDAVA